VYGRPGDMYLCVITIGLYIRRLGVRVQKRVNCLIFIILMENSQKIATLFGERQKIDKKIAKIQNLCTHPTKTVKPIRERLDSTTMVIRHVCDECYSIVGIPNNNELQNYLKQ